MYLEEFSEKSDKGTKGATKKNDVPVSSEKM